MTAPFDPRPHLERLDEAAAATALAGNDPYAAVAVSRSGKVVARAVNVQFSSGDPTAHAERLLLTKMGEQGTHFDGVWVVVNAEPCVMCVAALIAAGVAGIVFGAPVSASTDLELNARVVVGHAKRPFVLEGPVDGPRHAKRLREARAVSTTVRAAALR